MNKGCHLCEDWPCVSICTANALILPEPQTNDENTTTDNNKKPQPRLAYANIDTATCLPYSGPECGVCIDACPVDGALTLDMVKPVIDETLCTGCALCREVCITEPKSIHIASL